jgi:hypothetical protein
VSGYVYILGGIREGIEWDVVCFDWEACLYIVVSLYMASPSPRRAANQGNERECGTIGMPRVCCNTTTQHLKH